MGLFEKKYCDICGGKIRFIGRKVEDGRICKDCSSKLSPWFSERKKSTLDEIKEQLEYREQNREALESFQPTRVLGSFYKVMLDERAKKFIVTQEKRYQDGNPDILEYSMVTGCELDTDEHKTEQKRTVNGKSVSYNPPVYDYSYDFYCLIRVNHPYFSEMRFKLNKSAVHAPNMNTGGVNSLIGNAGVQFGSPEIQQYMDMANEIKETLMGARQEAYDAMNEANAPKTAVTCPYCGATTIPDQNGCCEFCGSPVKK